MRAKRLASITAFVVMLAMASTALAVMPKYVFFFLGDGMSSAQIQATEAYLTTKNGGSATLARDLQRPENRLHMSKFPVLGMQTTYDAYSLMTDSASAATAFACGIKTGNGVIGMDATKTVGYKSIARLAAENGRLVGIVSSVSLDHATPASYYASVPNRGLMNTIATQMVEAGFAFYGGGGLVAPIQGANASDSSVNIWNLLTEKGYTVLNDRETILALQQHPKNKVVCINPWLQDSAAMPYAIDRPATNLSLAEMTAVAIDTLAHRQQTDPAQDQGFFLMVEGGKIDWACHANDAMATIVDTLDFNDAIGVALDFYQKYPAQTLIVVTGDHETGGMSIGHAATGYTAYFDRLLGQTNSFTYFAQNQWKAHKAAFSKGYTFSLPNNLESNPEMLGLMQSVFGLHWADLNSHQKKKLEDAYDASMGGQNNNSSETNNLLYGSYEPIIVTITHTLNERAGIGWTSFSHTGVPVPVFAIGPESQRFSGFYDNTDIAKQMAKALDIHHQLPVVKPAP